MQIAAALSFITSLMDLVAQLAAAAPAANGARLAEILRALQEISGKIRQALDMIRAIVDSGQDRDLNDDEVAQLRKLDDEARALQLRSLQAPSTFEKPEGEQAQGRRAGAQATGSAGDSRSAGGSATGRSK